MAIGYTVQNPREVPEGTAILSWSDGTANIDWFEGEEFIKPKGMTAETAKGFIDAGFLAKKVTE